MSQIVNAQPYTLPVAKLSVAPPDGVVIPSKPTLAELTLTQQVSLIVPYLAVVIILFVACFLGGFALRMRERYRTENVPPIERVAIDKLSVRRARRAL